MSALTHAEAAALPRWVGWRNVTRNGRSTKAPFAADGSGAAKADDPATWEIRPRAEAWAARHVNGHGGGVGLQLGAVPERPGVSLGGVDLDACRDTSTGELEPWAAEVVSKLASYAEVSPSGTGAKVFFTYATGDVAALRAAMGTDHGRSFKRRGGEHPPAIELHIGNRYFAWTGQHLDGTPADLRPVPLGTLLWLVRAAGPGFAAGPEASGAGVGSAGEADPALMARLGSATDADADLARRWAGDATGLRDGSRSALAFALGAAIKRRGFDYAEMRALLRANPHTADWTATKGEANRGRELRRIWQRAGSAETEPPRDGAPGDALRADVARAAAMPQADYLAERLEMARRHRVPVKELDALRAEAARQARRAEATEAGAAASSDPRGRADLLVNGADLPDTAADLGGHLSAVPHLFDRGGPARIACDRARDGFVVEPLTLNGVVNEAHRVVRPWQWVKNRDGGMERRDVTLPERVAKLWLDDRSGWRLRPLDGVTSAPLLRDDGTVRAAEGYDPETRLWCERVPAVEVPAAPSKGDAEAALLRLRRHFRTFAFADASRVVEDTGGVSVVDPSKPPGADESAFLCALLSAVCRPCLWLAPALLVRAPEYSGSGTGKGLLVRCLSALAFGSMPTAITAGATAEEFDKRITAALMEAGATLFLDNVNSTALKSDVLASAITERPAAVRPLGRSATVRLNPTAFVAVTGNGLLLSEDMARRFLTVELDAGMEDPETRAFRSDPLADTLTERGALLRDALTIWRWGRQNEAGLAAGRAFGSFNQWARWCRDPLLALGCKDPVLRVADAKAKDPRRQSVAEVFQAWWEAHRDQPMAAAGLAEGVKAVADPQNRGRQYLASRIRALDGTRAAGFVLTRSASVGKWSPDTYTLRRTGGAAEGHRGHRDHGEHGPPPGDPMPPMTPTRSDREARDDDDAARVWGDTL